MPQSEGTESAGAITSVSAESSSSPTLSARLLIIAPGVWVRKNPLAVWGPGHPDAVDPSRYRDGRNRSGCLSDAAGEAVRSGLV